MSNRDEILNRIRNLRAKAGNHASSESEAAAAASLAAKLLAKHDVQETELELKTEGAVAGSHNTKAKVPNPVLWVCWSGIQALTETKMYLQGADFKFIGTPHDVEMGIYLCELIVGASKRGWAEFGETTKRTNYKSLMASRASFYQAMGDRLHKMMMQLANERAEARRAAHGTSTGSALVVVKSEIIKAKMAEMGLTLGKVEDRRQRFAFDPKAAEFGDRVARNVNLNRPLDGAEEFGAIK